MPGYRGPSWSWSYWGWIYNYLWNQCLSPLRLWVRTTFMARCTRYKIKHHNHKTSYQHIYLYIDFNHKKVILSFMKFILQYRKRALIVGTNKFIHYKHGCTSIQKPLSISAKCDKGQFQCNDRTCIDKAALCDGLDDCVDGLDELHCKAQHGNLFMKLIYQ